MPYQTPSASQFIQLKRLQSNQTANKNTDPLKFRAPNPYDGYQQGTDTKFGPNALISNKFIQPPNIPFYSGAFTVMGDLSDQDDEYQELDMTGLPFYFNGTNYGDGENGGMFMSSNNVITFGGGNDAYQIANWAENETTTNAIFINARDRYSFEIKESPVITSGTLKYKVIDQKWADLGNEDYGPTAFSQIRLITDSATNNQYVEYRLQKTDRSENYNLFGTYFAEDLAINEFQSQIPTEYRIYLFTSNSTGTTWSFGTSEGLPY